jgi:hypothetical protein
MPKLLTYAKALSEVTEDIDSDAATYAVCSAQKRFEIWGDGASNEDGWERATVAFFEIVNANLVGASHKFYALYGGNDLSGMFLTPEEFTAARRLIKRRSDWPWIPVNEPPHYGYPNFDGS